MFNYRVFFARLALALAICCSLAFTVCAAPVLSVGDGAEMLDGESAALSPSDSAEDSSDSVDSVLADAYDSPALLISSGGDIDAGCWFVATSAFGAGTSHRFYFDREFASGSLIMDSLGFLWNNSQSSIYLYCPDYPDYTIYAPRFGYFQYRTNDNNYNWADARIILDAESSSSLILSDTQYRPSDASPVIVFLLSVLAFFGLIMILRRAVHA